MRRFSTILAFWVKTFLFACMLAALTLSMVTPASSSLGFNVIMRDVQVEPISGQLTHEVEAHVSVLDNEGAPVKNLQGNNFTVLEDSEPVQFELSEGAASSLSLVLAVDTSYGMAGNGLARAQQASTKFISRMGENDNIAILSFNTKINVAGDFSNDKAAVTGSINKLAAAPGSGTCLYDGIYKAIQMVSAQQEGQHAVLVMTDGRDEMPNSDKPCSAVTIDDVIRLATSGQNVPIYAIGVGKQIDDKSLDRLALLTGGSFLQSKDFSALDGGFEKMYSQLKDQYLVRYISNAASGEHSLSIRVNIGSEKDEDRRAFLVTEAAPVITIASPSDGQTLTAKTTVSLGIAGQKDAVKQVEFQVNDQLAGKDDTAPFEFILDPAAYPAGSLEITAVAMDSSEKVLGKATVRVTIPPAEKAAAVTEVFPTALPSATPPPTATPTTQPGSSTLPLVIGGGAGLVVLLVVLGLVMVKPFSKSKMSVAPPQAARQSIPSPESEATFDGLASSSNALAELTVLASDDPARTGERIAITQAVTSLGRGTSNDISFPNDHPVSRKHASIELRAGKFSISEILTDTNGVMKPPTFGTFVNDQKLAGGPVTLQSGDEIRLGNRLKLKFQSFASQLNSQADSDATVDNLDDNTLD